MKKIKRFAQKSLAAFSAAALVLSGSSMVFAEDWHEAPSAV